MALVPSTIKSELSLMFSEHPVMGLTPGQNVAKATKNYLSMSTNGGGFPFTTVMNEPFGMNMGKIFEGKLPVGVTIGQAIGTELMNMAQTYMSGSQLGPPVTAPTHIPQLMQLFNSYAPSPMDFGRSLGGIISDWIGTWVVSGLIPGTPPVPFSGPLK